MIRLRAARPRCSAMAAVLDNGDLLALVLEHARLGPRELVMASRVSRLWHETCYCDVTLAVGAALAARRLTKRALMGLFALEWREADALPRAKCPRLHGGSMYLYDATVAVAGWSTCVGDSETWRTRLAQRARDQRSIELAFGPEWRKLRWGRT